MSRWLITTTLVIFLTGCDGPFDHIGDTIKKNLATVTYDNGISITEGKIVADAYLYIHGNHIGPAPYVNITDGDNVWLGIVYTGFGVSPVQANAPPVQVNKHTGEITWAQGPTVHRIDDTQIVNKKISAGRSFSGEALTTNE